MRTLSLLLVAASLASLPGCTSNHPYRTGTIERGEEGQVAKGLLAEPATFDGLPCAGWVEFYPDGHLRSADLAVDFTVAGHVLPQGSRLFLREGGTLERCWLSKDTRIGEVICAGGPAKIATEFYPDGNLESAFVRDDQVVLGAKPASAMLRRVRFDEYGKVLPEPT